MTENQTRVHAGIPTGGRYAATTHSENIPALAGPVQVTFKGDFTLHASAREPLPELPPAAGEPKVSFDYSDEGKLETHISLGGTTMTFWNDDADGEVTNNVDSGFGGGEDEAAPWSHISSYDDWEKARTWGEAVHARIDGAALELVATATADDAAQASIVAFATGRPEQVADQTPQQSSARRASAALAVCDEGQGKDLAMRDLLIDLRHYADEHGIDIYQAMDESYGYYQHEKADPGFRQS